MMEAHINIPAAVDDVDVLVWRLQKFTGIVVRAEGEKIILQGDQKQLVPAQNYALRFIGPESIHCLHVSTRCLSLLRISGLIKNFEDMFDVIVCLKEGGVVILKGRKTDTERFLGVFKALDSQSLMDTGTFSMYKLSNLRLLCDKFHVAFDEVPCDPVLHMALFTYFSSLLNAPHSGQMAESQPVSFLEIYRKRVTGPLVSRNSEPVISGSGQQQTLSLNNRNMARGSKSADRENLRPAESVKKSAIGLRAVVIDGSNVAFAHGNQNEFSPQGIQMAVDYFIQRGHSDVVAVVPRHRQGKGGVLFERLERQGYLCYSPSRMVGTSRQVSDDDRIILQLAVERDAVVISNDQFRTYRDENEQFKNVIDHRLLQYTIGLNTFVMAEDPHGGNNPSLSDLLRRKPTT